MGMLDCVRGGRDKRAHIGVVLHRERRDRWSLLEIH